MPTKDDSDKVANRYGAAPQVFVPGAGAPDSKRAGVPAAAKPPARTTAPAGTPIRKSPGPLLRSNATPVSDRPPPGAQNTATLPRTVGGQTARLKLPELDEPDDTAATHATPKAARPLPVPRPLPPPERAKTPEKPSDLRMRSGTVKLDAIAPPDVPSARLKPSEHAHASPVPLLHDHEEPEPRPTPTARAVPSALADQRLEAERAKEREEREARVDKQILEAEKRERARREQEEREEEARAKRERLDEEQRALAREEQQRRDDAKRVAPDAAPGPSLAANPPSPPLYAGSDTMAPVSRWPLTIAIGCIALALGALLPLPFRKHLAPARGDARGAAAASASAATGTAASTTVNTVNTGVSSAPALPVLRAVPAPASALPAPSSSEGPKASGPLNIAAPATSPKPTATSRPNITPRKPGGPPGDIF